MEMDSACLCGLLSPSPFSAEPQLWALRVLGTPCCVHPSLQSCFPPTGGRATSGNDPGSLRFGQPEDVQCFMRPQDTQGTMTELQAWC